MKKVFALVLSAIMILGLCACNGNPSSSSNSSGSTASGINAHEFSFSVAQGESTTYYKTAEKFAEMMKEASDGKINIKVYGNCSLSGGDQTAALEMIQKGSIDMGMVTAAVCGNMIQDLRVTVIPWGFSGEEHVDAALTKGSDLYALYEQEFSDVDIHLLGIAEHGFRDIMTSKLNVRQPSDLKGLKLRVLATPVLNDFFIAMGTNVADIGPTEIYTSLQNGTIDGQENPLVYSYFSDFTKVAPYISIWRYAYDAHPFMMSETLWNSLTADEQALFVQVSDEWIGVQRAMMRDAYDGAYQACLDDGCTIVELTDEEIAVFKAEASKTSAPYIEQLANAWDLLQKCDPKA